jgi:hypothetical protein
VTTPSFYCPECHDVFTDKPGKLGKPDKGAWEQAQDHEARTGHKCKAEKTECRST